uniref:Uncharacterized protein n=1 Tax=Arundo donax TaxID=35708 RepID=A0A0A9HFF7_ARUDO
MVFLNSKDPLPPESIVADICMSSPNLQALNNPPQ